MRHDRVFCALQEAHVLQWRTPPVPADTTTESLHTATQTQGDQKLFILKREAFKKIPEGHIQRNSNYIKYLEQASMAIEYGFVVATV